MDNKIAPVLLIAFNRPELTKQTFMAIRAAKPSVFYFAVDGPRNHNAEDFSKCELVKKLADLVDWPCELHTLFRNENVGCGYGPSTAISWAFESSEQLIILEDDCVASKSFFEFCSEMLLRYKDDERIWMISGRCHHPDYPFFEKYDYIFTRDPHSWGWATWKRCWNCFDLHMSDYPAFLQQGGFLNVFPEKREGRYFNKQFSAVYNSIKQEVTHSWDSQWCYAYLKNNGIGIVPARNLIKNIGVDGTHSNNININSSVYQIEANDLTKPYRHPLFVLPIRDYEYYHFKKHTKPLSLGRRVFNRIIGLFRVK